MDEPDEVTPAETWDEDDGRPAGRLRSRARTPPCRGHRSSRGRRGAGLARGARGHAGARPRRGVRVRARLAAPARSTRRPTRRPRATLRPASRTRADPCRHGGYGSTPSWCGAAAARSREHASELIAAGRVTVNGGAAHKPATGVTVDADIVVRDDPDRPDYVSRGGHKLAGALADFAEQGLSVSGRRCLDAGASTGGFTDVLLRAGAAEVVAVDVGYGQLAWSLRQDPRVRVHDRTNVRERDAGAGRRSRGRGRRRPVVHLPRAGARRPARRDRTRRRPGADGEAAVRGRQGPARPWGSGPRAGPPGGGRGEDRRGGRPTRLGCGGRHGELAAGAGGQRRVLRLAASRRARTRPGCGRGTRGPLPGSVGS